MDLFNGFFLIISLRDLTPKPMHLQHNNNRFLDQTYKLQEDI